MDLRNYDYGDNYTPKNANLKRARFHILLMALDYGIGGTVTFLFGMLLILFVLRIAHTNDIERTYIFIFFNLTLGIFFIMRGNKRREQARFYSEGSGPAKAKKQSRPAEDEELREIKDVSALLAALAMMPSGKESAGSPTFRVGDRVRVKYRGQEGYIIDKNGSLYMVSLKDGAYVDSYTADQLEKCR